MVNKFSPSELYNLDKSIIEFTLPRLKAFAKMELNGHPVDLTYNEWIITLDKIIFAFEQMLLDDEGEDQFTIKEPIIDFIEDGKYFRLVTLKRGKVKKVLLEKHRAKVREGMLLFSKYWMDLWD